MRKDEGFAAEAEPGDEEFPELETVHVRVGPIEQLQRWMGLDDALVAFRVGDDSEGNIGNVFGQSGDAGVDPGGLGKRNGKGGGAKGVLAASEPGAGPG